MKNGFKETLCAILPAFGVGILSSLFLPPYILVGVTSIVSITVGIIFFAIK